jgi:hypothetical protein
MRYLASEEGNEVYCAADQSVSPLGNLPGTIPMPEGVVETPDLAEVKTTLPKIVEALDY